MLQGKENLRDLINEIEWIESKKEDLIVPTGKLKMVPRYRSDQEMNDTALRIVGHREFPHADSSEYSIGPVAHQQISDRLKIPRKYYERMRDVAPTLLAENVNHWFGKNGEKRMVRTLDGQCRAILSDRYRPFDHALLAKAALPALNNIPGIEIKSCQITDKRLYIQAVTPRIQGEVKVGDIVQAGVIISNSEVGFGAFMVELLLYRLSCLNGMVRGQSLRRIHAGKRIDQDDADSYQIFTNEAIEKDNEAFMLKCRDMVNFAFNESAFHTDLIALRSAAEDKIEKGRIDNVVKNVTQRFRLTDEEGALALSNLIEDGDLSKYGVANAVTALANDGEDYDRGVELERLGGKIIDLPASDWTAINRLAA